MKFNWNFLEGEGVQKYKPSVVEDGYFLELHICAIIGNTIFTSCRLDLSTCTVFSRLNAGPQLNAGLVYMPGQNRYFLNKRRGCLIGVPAFI